MSIKAVSWALEQPIGGNLKLVLIALADSHSEGRGCFPSIETIIKKAYISKPTYKRVIAQLEERGYVTRQERFTDTGRRTSNTFLLHFGVGDQFDAHVGDQIDTGEGYHGDTGVGLTVDTHLTVNSKGNGKVNDHGDFAIAFWPNYPFKKNKAQAEKAFNRLPVEKQVAAIAGLKTFQFRQDAQLHASTYLNNSRWEDEQEKPNGTHQQSNGKLSAVERVRRANAHILEETGGTIMDEDGRVIRAPMD